ncbi:MORC family CW-type zinc finger protein 1 [Dermochelys coriacea]|uniref:MORC family CW-type zinc finger protein 1 n=1 Tax=Dermochelys coriacea TaxID=27794 RepID=UPI001CA82CFA|nr:MORC family CW-type zinc finger protein 1 [Dermochelys coriacea]
MAAGGRYGALRRAELRLDYLQANATTHDFLFGAIAELIDNARDAGATRLDIFTVDNDKLPGGFMLCFLDDGCGMTPKEATDLIYFGRSSKRTSLSRMIGHYGNGLKSGSMRIGKDFILFTKKEDTMTCVIFSQTFCEAEGLYEMIVPITSWSRNTRKPILGDLEKFTLQTSIIFKYSPFKTETELLQQFDAIYGRSGTFIVIYNLKLMLSGEPELDIRTDSVDILIAGLLDNLPERWSLRAYTAVLYFDPHMRIFIQAEKVETKRLPYCFYRPRMYPYITSSFKGTAMKEIKKAEVDVNIAEQAVEEAKCQLKHLEGSLLHEVSKLALQDALENAKRKREKLQEKQRELRRPKKFYLMFGINIENRSHDGMFIYNNSRLVRMYEKVGPHLKQGSRFSGGAVGMVDMPLEALEPTHNKQAFVNVKEYNHLLTSMEHYLIQYWKDIGISQKGVTSFWNEFGYLSDKWLEKPSDAIQYKRRRAVEIPALVQCDICLKWRVLSLSTDIENKDHCGIWTCEMIPGPLENKCNRPERLPSIPLGTLNRLSLSPNDKEKLLIDSIQRHQRKLENLQSQKSRLIKPHTVAQCGDSSGTLLINKNENVQKTVSQRNAFHREPAPSSSCLDNCSRKQHVQKRGPKRWDISEHRATSQKKARPKEQQIPPISLLEKHHQVSLVPHESQQMFLEKSEVAKIKKEDSDLEIICVMVSEDETEDLSKCGESKEVIWFNKGSFGGKQKQCDLQRYICCDRKDATKIKGNNLSSSKLESALAEDPKRCAEGKVQVPMQEMGAVAHIEESSQCMSAKKTIETLTSLLREVLLYFLPDCKLSREQLNCMSAEDLVSMFKPEGPSEQLKKPALRCSQVMKDYFVQHESKILRKIQSLTRHSCEVAYVSELQQRRCEIQIKATQEKLKTLREKMSERIHPELLIELGKHCQSVKEKHDLSLEGDHVDDLKQIDGYLEELLKQDMCQSGIVSLPIVNTNTAELGEPVVLCEEIVDVFKN